MATRWLARTEARACTSISRRSRTSRWPRADRSSSSRPRASRSTSSPSAARTSSRAPRGTCTPRQTGSRTTRRRRCTDQGLQSESTRYIREYGAELGGPILKDRVWLWAAGSRQDISLSPSTFSPGEVPYPETTILEPWSAKLNAQISNANSASLYFLRSDRIEDGTPIAADLPPETRWNFRLPTDFYKVEDSHVFSPDLFGSIFASYENVDYLVLPVGGLERDVQYYGSSWHNTNTLQRWPGAAEAGQPAGVTVLRHRQGQPRAEDQLQLPSAVVESFSGLPGSRNSGRSSLGDENVALLSRNGRPNFVMPVLDRHDRRHPDHGQPHGRRRPRYDLQQLKNRPTLVAREPRLLRTRARTAAQTAETFPGFPRWRTTGRAAGSFSSRTGNPGSRPPMRSGRRRAPCCVLPTRVSRTR